MRTKDKCIIEIQDAHPLDRTCGLLLLVYVLNYLRYPLFSHLPERKVCALPDRLIRIIQAEGEVFDRGFADAAEGL